MTQDIRQDYHEAVQLAEAGRYDAAIRKLERYLRKYPQDAEALNDAGTILYCMSRGQEAVGYFQRACSCSTGTILTQVYFNLCEVYISEGMPEKAAELLERMRAAGILSMETVNRIARVFVDRRQLGPAVEMLLLSLDLSDEQKILEPIIEVLKSKRPRLGLVSSTQTPLRPWKTYFEKRYHLNGCCDGDSEPIGSGFGDCDIAIFTDLASFAEKAAVTSAEGGRIVLLSAEDLDPVRFKSVCWSSADLVGLPDESSADVFKALLEDSFAGRTFVLPAGIDPQTMEFKARKPGKKLAALGPWNLKRNPMFLLQCMQKLHYLDADARLYLAGEFDDPQLERYVQYMIEVMDLDTTVFLDPMPKNLNRWLRDKQYIVSASIDSTGIEQVHAAMAAGLKPVVHRFCGAETFLDESWLFTLAEDFCRRIGETPYDSAQYRRYVCDHFDVGVLSKRLDRVVQQLEREWKRNQDPESNSDADSVFESLQSGFPMTEAAPVQDVQLTSQAGRKTRNKLPDHSIEQIAERALQAARQLQDLSSQDAKPVESAVE